mmetsp:Transcript_55/g.169  ORF Transcript_55/g.169 Transcript_55/m.169 type:complete len:239 (+) Transcript_55:62-778(+)
MSADVDMAITEAGQEYATKKLNGISRESTTDRSPDFGNALHSRQTSRQTSSNSNKSSKGGRCYNKMPKTIDEDLADSSAELPAKAFVSSAELDIIRNSMDPQDLRVQGRPMPPDRKLHDLYMGKLMAFLEDVEAVPKVLVDAVKSKRSQTSSPRTESSHELSFNSGLERLDEVMVPMPTMKTPESIGPSTCTCSLVSVHSSPSRFVSDYLVGAGTAPRSTSTSSVFGPRRGISQRVAL